MTTPAVTAVTPALQVTDDQPVCESCGQAVAEPSVLQLHAGTIADIYDIWPTGKHGKRIGPKVLVVELKRQA